MIDAKLLATPRKTDGDSEYAVYGVWVPRKGDNLRATVEVVANFGTNLTATIFEKNYEDPGDGITSGVDVRFTATTGRQTMELLGAKELVRFQVTVATNSGLTTGRVGWVLLRFLQPVWFESVD